MSAVAGDFSSCDFVILSDEVVHEAWSVVSAEAFGEETDAFIVRLVLRELFEL